ncbi:unnamed protein product, partial [Meganyctiphanes norvegica]
RLIHDYHGSLTSRTMWLFNCSLFMLMGYAYCGCPDARFEEIGGTCYYFSEDHGDHNIKASWESARTVCKDLGTELEMTVDLVNFGIEGSCCSEGLLLRNIHGKGGTDTWLGAEDMDEDDQFHWTVSGEAVDNHDSYWGRHEPNHIQAGVRENCMSTSMYRDGEYTRMYFNDAACDIAHHYVCQVY